MRLHLPNAGALRLDPGTNGLEHCGLRTLSVAAGEPLSVELGDLEAFVLPLRGSVIVEVQDAREPGSVEAKLELVGRTSVFERVSDFAYIGRDSIVTLSSESGAEVALPLARCEVRRSAAYGAAESVPVEVRGAGQATRQVNAFGTETGFAGAEKLLACEILAPGGNWSSYPPHKHDVTDPCRVANEEIYYYRIAEGGFGVHHTYTGAEHVAAGLEPIDLGVIVRDGDAVLVPYGYHGPCVAPPEHPMYYLNVLAGPGERSMAFCDDPAHGWIRAEWADQVPDPRVPMTSAQGVTSR